VARPAKAQRPRSSAKTVVRGAKTRTAASDMPVIKSTAGASGKGR
jgi:hypothetical protein